MEKPLENHGSDCHLSGSNNLDQTESLLLNIEHYKTQLDEVNAAIDSASEEDKIQLNELQLNLVTILELSLNQLDQVKTSEDGDKNKEDPESLCIKLDSGGQIDAEFEKFKMEIASLEMDNAAMEKNITKPVDLEESLRSLEGQEVRVPFMERWGGYSYHNAVVLSLIAGANNSIDLDNPEVLVLFSQPTCLSMLPCRFFLEGRCKFESDKCKFSHGKKISVEALREYSEPDRDKIVSGSNVLVLHSGNDIWHRGKIEDVLENRAGFSFNCSICGEVVDTSLECMIPLFAEGDDKIKIEESCENHYAPKEKLKEIEEESICVPSDVWLNNSLNCKLGEWEKYTKGIGSKLMAKMGYIIGTGLGPKGEGRVDPVTAYVYPQGVSLDYCKHLRESSNGETILEVEKRLLHQQKKEEKKKERLHNNSQSPKETVFDIINEKLSFKGNANSSLSLNKESMELSKTCLKKNSTKELNRKNFQLGSQIDKLKEEVKTLNRSKNRQTGDSATIKAINQKLEDKMKLLSDLRTAEKHIESERLSRENIKKLCLF